MGWRAARGAARTGPLSARPAFDQQCAAPRRAAPGDSGGSSEWVPAADRGQRGAGPPGQRPSPRGPAARGGHLPRPHIPWSGTLPPPPARLPPPAALALAGTARPRPPVTPSPAAPNTAGCPSAPGAQCRPVGRWAGAGPGARSRSPSRNAISIKNPLLGTFRQRCFIGIHTAPPARPGARVTGGDPAAQRAGGRTAARAVTPSAAAEPQPGDGGFAGAGSGTPQLPPSAGGMEQPGCPLCRGEAGRRRGALRHAARWVASRGQRAGGQHPPSPSLALAAPRAHLTGRAAARAGPEQRAGHVLGTTIARATGAWMGAVWHPQCPRWDCAPGMASQGEEGALAPLILGLVQGKGKRLGGKSTFLALFLSLFFFSYESKNISWFFVIRNMLGVFFGQQPVKYRFPTKGMQGPFARRAKDLLKNKIKIPVF